MRTRALSAKKLISSPSDGGAGSTDAPSKRPKAEDTVPEPERPSVDMHRVHGEVHDSDEVSDSESDDASETPEEEQARYAEIRAAVEARVKARLADLPAYSTSTDPDYHEADDEPLDADTVRVHVCVCVCVCARVRPCAHSPGTHAQWPRAARRRHAAAQN